MVAPYWQTRDETHLRFLSGPDAEKPVFFHVKRLPAAFVNQVLAQIIHPAERQTTAFNAACHLVTRDDKVTPYEFDGDALRVYPSNTQVTKGLPFVAKDGAFGVDMAPQEAWPQVITDCFGIETVREMGQIAIDFAKLRVGARGPFSLWVG